MRDFREIKSVYNRYASISRVILCFVFCCMIITGEVSADIKVTVAGPGGQASQNLPDDGGSFDLNLPLNKNAVNSIIVTAQDAAGNSVSQELAITQVSLDQIVVSKVTSERLSVAEVEQLVADGVIDLGDPENYNVSTFDIVLTINKRPVPISLPIAIPVNKPEEENGFENIKLPSSGGGSSGKPKSPPVQVVFFEQSVPSTPGEPSPPPIPGVIIIEGNIKSLKEFFNVRLLLLNTSGIFTLSDVIASIELPVDKLSSILPADGIVAFNNILPGDGEQPGQMEKTFVIRGNEIGIHDVTVHFGGTVTGPGITTAIPFNGSAVTEVEVKGPPTLQVQVTHPDTVVAGVPYELTVDITNAGELTAMYASLELDVGAGAKLAACTLDGNSNPDCVYIDGPEVRNFGHIEPGQSVSEIFTILPSQTGSISSCMAASDQNISLQVLVGDIGCIVGHFPPLRGVPSGIPTVNVLPTPNAFGIHEDSPVTAFFSERMNESSITTGLNGTFNVFDSAGEIIPGRIRFERLNANTDTEKTVAIWSVNNGTTNRLASNADYSVILTTGILDYADGNTLYNNWQSKFTTTDTGINDTTPPMVSLSVGTPVNPNFVLPGELIKINAYASDQGSGISRVEMRIKDMDEEGAAYQLVDQKTVFDGDRPPYIFSINSATLVAGHTYQTMATAYDKMGNAQNAIIALIIADSAAPPTITLPDDPASDLLQGISVILAPELTGGVNAVRFYLDGAATPFKTLYLHPYQAILGTLNLSLGSHVIRAVAEDGLGQTGEDTYNFTLIENINMPVVNFGAAVDGAQYVSGDSILITGNAVDPVGIASMRYFLDSTTSDPIYTGTAPILLNSTQLGIGDHTVYILATNNLAISNDIHDPASALEFSIVDAPPGPPPEPPMIAGTSYPDNGMVTVTGTSIAGARVDITNLALNITISVHADTAGHFSGTIPGDAGHVLNLVCYDFHNSQDPSDPATATVQPAPVLDHITISPVTMSFDTANVTQDIVVTGHYVGGDTANLTGIAAFSSSNAGVASVNASGRVVALSSGTAAITATAGGKQAQVDVTVNIVVLTNITVDPSQVDFISLGQTTQLSVTAHYSDGSTQPLTGGISYQSGNPNVTTVDSSGRLTATGNGTTQINVYYSGIPAITIGVSVDTGLDPAPTVSILSPVDWSDVERGDTVTVSIQAEDDIGGVNRIYLETSGETVHADNRQIAPPSLSVTQGFTFVVSNQAAIGGTILLKAWAEDTSGNLSEVQTITLNLTDETSPMVTISAPAQQTPYNYGDTVNIVVDASDAVNITQIRYETTGALNESGSQGIPNSPSAGASFSFTIPYGVSEPNVKIHAYAMDALGNEGTAVPVDIILTGADITPPETIVTSVDNPGTDETTTITYEVTSGLEDLDYVLVYFRKNGIGTFNRYTGPLGSTDGRYTPQSGNTGTIVFDSTRMGGDGNYEFYTVGVDLAGNHEPAPDDGAGNLLPDQAMSFAAGTIWTIIDTPAVIGEGDTTYDDQNIRIIGSGVIVTMNGSHSFHNVEILNGAVLTHEETTIDSVYQIDISAWSLTIDANNSRIDVTGRGYTGGKEYNEFGRTQGNVYGSTYHAGGSHGGLGGVYSSGVAGSVYGSLTDPGDLGSGGGADDHTDGGDGGGLIELNVINLVLDGNLKANGSESAGGQAGDGSGGSINIFTRTLSGSANINANGGGANSGVGGGGGRVAIRYLDMATMDINNITALGGDGYYGKAANGTVYLRQDDETDGAIVITGRGLNSPWTHLTIPPGYSFDTVTLSNQARVLADDPIILTGRLLITGESVLSHSNGNEAGLVVEAAIVQIDEGSAIDVTGRGYSGGTGYNDRGLTLAGNEGAYYHAGGSYGGKGAGYNYSDSFIVYGDPKYPDELGSGGGADDHTDGGDGGGLVYITASDAVIVNGAVRANGGESAGGQAGDGSGGAILIHTSRLEGVGTIESNGGGNGSGVAGGGGRVAIYYDYIDPTNNLADKYNITALAGHGYYDTRQASAGTVYLKSSDQNEGSLYIDDHVVDGTGNPNGTAASSTPLTHIGFGTAGAISDLNLDGVNDSMTTDGLVRLLPNGLVGLRLNPDINQVESFVIQSNDDTIITVVSPNENGVYFDTVAHEGDMYAGTFTYDNLIFRRGGNLKVGDMLTVTDTLTIDEYGLLTHFDATTTFISWLELSVGHLVIENTGRIDVTGRGYIGGREYNEFGRTQGNVYGSTYHAGGSYGGLGGIYSSGSSGFVYGSLTDPIDLGSGGGADDHTDGGDGGGLVYITASDMTVNGAIRANGGESAGGQAGDGSGGTVNIVTDTLEGTGTIEANGGGNSSGVGGGGGRIAIDYSGTLALDEANIQAAGGMGYYGTRAGNGMVFYKRPGQVNGDLIIDGLGTTGARDATFIDNGYTFDNITLRNNARANADNGIHITNTLLVTGESVLSHSTGNEAGLVVEAAIVQIDEGSAIDVTGRGYSGGTGYNDRGLTLAGNEGAYYHAGGSYGGKGAGYNYSDSFIVYGDPKYPDELGSGGGADDHTDGGDGGGLVYITASDAVIVNGAVRANGGESAGGQAGDGSGGAILIHTSRLEGVGTIESNGGGNGSGVAGGGGRVAIYYDYIDPTNNLADKYNITALAGHGYYDTRQASAGTVYLKSSDQNEGSLYIDDHVVDGTGNPNGTAASSTPLTHIGFGTAGAISDLNLDGVNDSMTTDGLVRLLPNGLVGLRLNPDINQVESFVIQSNDDTIITVVSPNENGVYFDTVAHEGDMYAGTFTYDNLIFRRGGNLKVGDMLTVTDTLTIDEYGLLTHFDATTTFISWLELSVGHLVIENTGRIDVTGRGYIGGREYNEFGRTQGNVYGSTYHAGGSYGGLGGIYSSGSSGFVYGSLTDPIDLGSGGGADDHTDGGDGGGLVYITASDMTVNGAIRANGGESAGGQAGDGSGGTVNIVTDTLEGTGTIEANGGGNSSGVGGGGGRIAIDYSETLALDEANIQAAGGLGYYGSRGEQGSVAVNDVEQ